MRLLFISTNTISLNYSIFSILNLKNTKISPLAIYKTRTLFITGKTNFSKESVKTISKELFQLEKGSKKVGKKESLKIKFLRKKI